ncbi:MAG TPA: universal stress protein [Acidimicrobiia bacterium]|jgi:nucleotide-binding universal stress UspA family protein|nr:universal stress protein [Acidimicrobiia bacterium]
MDIIVLGIDGSKGAQAAAQWAAEQANRTGGRVIAVFAVPRSELWSLSAVQINIDEVLAEFRQLLDGRWTAPLRKADVEYTSQLVRGDPATELLRVAERAGAALIALGSKSHSNLADLIVGGTVHKVINRSSIPVVLVPAAPPPKKTATRAARQRL